MIKLGLQPHDIELGCQRSIQGFGKHLFLRIRKRLCLILGQTSTFQAIGELQRVECRGTHGKPRINRNAAHSRRKNGHPKAAVLDAA